MRLRIISWNVNGIRAISKKGFLDWLQQTSPDVLCLQETKAHKAQLAESITEPEGYHTFWNEADKKGYSGTAIFSKRQPVSISYGMPRNITTAYNLSDSKYGNAASEGRVITAEFPELYVVSVYTPNTKDSLERLELRHASWDPAFLDYVTLLEKKKPVVFCGDLNVAHQEIDLARPKQNEGKKGFTKEEREGFDNYVKAGFIDSYRHLYKEGGHYTWWTHWANARERNVGWRIDYCMLSKQLKENIIEANIHDQVMGSDHAPVSVTLEFTS